MRIERTRDRGRLEAFLRRDAPSQIYTLADLDDFFWPETTWYALIDKDGEFRSVCLRLDKLEIPILSAVCPRDDADARALLEGIREQLPARFFVNLGLGLESVFEHDHAFEGRSEYHKMLLRNSARIEEIDTSAVEPLSARDLDELAAFYREDAYEPGELGGRFFEPYMLENGPYVAIRERGRLVCVAGVHVFSPRYGVAGIGNVATRPECRGRGLGRAATAALCRTLSEHVARIGLNVQIDNVPARRCYEGLGFEFVRPYLEGVFVRRGAGA